MQVLIIGGKSGVGLSIANYARQLGHTVVVTDRERVDLTKPETIEQLAVDIRNRWKGELIFFNAYVRTNDNSELAHAQTTAVETLWSKIRDMDVCFAVMSSTAAYKAGPGANHPVYALYIKSKQALNAVCIKHGFDQRGGRKARMVLFEPGQMQKPGDTAPAKLSPKQVWGAISAAVELNYSFMRIGGQA